MPLVLPLFLEIIRCDNKLTPARKSFDELPLQRRDHLRRAPCHLIAEPQLALRVGPPRPKEPVLVEPHPEQPANLDVDQFAPQGGHLPLTTRKLPSQATAAARRRRCPK